MRWFLLNGDGLFSQRFSDDAILESEEPSHPDGHTPEGGQSSRDIEPEMPAQPELTVVEREPETPPAEPGFRVPGNLKDRIKTQEDFEVFVGAAATAVEQLEQAQAAQQQAAVAQQAERHRDLEWEDYEAGLQKAIERGGDDAQRVFLEVEKFRRDNSRREMSRIVEGRLANYQRQQAVRETQRDAFWNSPENQDLHEMRDLVEEMVERDGVDASVAARMIRKIRGKAEDIGYVRPQEAEPPPYIDGLSPAGAKKLAEMMKRSGVTSGVSHSSVPSPDDMKSFEEASDALFDQCGSWTD